ncbi:MAG: hypothetical protein J6A59_13965 [Lachnospiraceae bacterium]|nr:hypothetical protein [Lachnospiraceae bacterium]
MICTLFTGHPVRRVHIITLTGLFCQTDAGSGLKEDLTGLGQDYITYYGYDQMSRGELALSLTIDIFFGAKSGYDDLNIKKKKVDVDLDDFVPDNATSKVNKIDGDDLVPDNTSAVINRADVDNVVANTQGFGGCFVEGTEIKTIEGDKNIEDIHAGDMVYSKNTETGEEGYKEVVRVFKKKTYELVYLTVGDEEIITTSNHPFYVVDEGFVEAGNLQIGDKVETADGEILEIEAITIEYLDEPIQIYNFEVADWHTYYVSEEEVLVHNMCMRNDVYVGNTNPNALRYNGDGTWTSNAGLTYGQGSIHGNRVNHVIDHTHPNPSKPKHTVYNVDESNVIGLVDEAWVKKGQGIVQGNGNVVYDIDMGKIVGTNGETHIRIVTDGYTNNIVTAFPIP